MKKLLVFLVYLLSMGAAMTKANPITIDYLKNHPNLVETCARWSYSSWGHLTPERTWEDYLESRRQYLNDDQLPFTLVAFDGKKPVGMCSLTKNRGILPELEPWVATLYVEQEYRQQGVAAQLDQAICQKAKELGYKRLYCFTSDPNLVPLAEKHGWRKRGMDRIHDHEVTVMEKDLQSS